MPCNKASCHVTPGTSAAPKQSFGAANERWHDDADRAEFHESDSAWDFTSHEMPSSLQGKKSAPGRWWPRARGLGVSRRLSRASDTRLARDTRRAENNHPTHMQLHICTISWFQREGRTGTAQIFGRPIVSFRQFLLSTSNKHRRRSLRQRPATTSWRTGSTGTRLAPTGWRETSHCHRQRRQITHGALSGEALGRALTQRKCNRPAAWRLDLSPSTVIPSSCVH